MAKRDKLYTVNKWNKPFFEDDRRKRLYALGDRIIYGLKEGLGAERNSYGDVGGVDANVKMPSYLQKAFTSFNDYANPSHYQNLAKVNFAEGDDKPLYGSSTINDTSSTGTKPVSLWSTTASGIANAAPDLVKAGILYFNHPETGELMAYTPPDLSKGILKSSMVSIPNPDLKPFAAGVASKLPTAPSLAPTLSEHLGIDTAALTSEATKKAVGDASRKLVEQFPPQAAAKGKNFFSTNLGLGLALTAADIGGDYLRSLARKPELSDTTAARVGDVLSKAGTLVGTGLMATGYGLPVGLLALGVGKTLGAIADQFGSKFIDKGARNRATQLRGINTNGSDEYLGNLWAMVSPGEEDSYVRGIFAGSRDKNRAQANNEDMYDAVEDAQRNIRDAWRNNQFMRDQHALSDYGVTAMGGKLNRCKCNKKATGGILNNSYIDTSSPSGYDIMMTALGNQELKNQMQQNTNSSLGNSFMDTSDMGTVFADGGIMIKPGNKGKFTAKAKRHGMGVQQFANYVLAHKDKFPSSTIKQAVFAKNSHTWKKAFGGKLNYGNNEDIRDNSFFSGQTLYELGGTLQAAGSNWGNVSEINEGGTHEENPYEGVQVGVDPEGTPNLVEEGEVIWNDYVFSNRIECPKEVCRTLRVGVKKNGFTFAEVAKKLLKESKERPNDPISKRGLEANMQKLEDAQEEVKKKMEADEAVEQFNNLPPEQLVAIMQQEGEKAQNAVALEQMAQELLNMPPEQQQAIAQLMAMEQALAQGMPQGPSPEEQAMMLQLMAQQQMPQGINPQEALAQAAAMLQAGLNGAALGGKLCFGGRKFAEGGELTEQPQAEPETAGQSIDSEMAKYSDEELQDMIEDYQEAESSKVKVTKGKLARLRKKAEKAQAELERRHSEENAEQPQEERQEPSQEEIQAAALAQAMQAQQPIEGQPQLGMSPEQAMMMLQQMGGQPLMSPEEMAAMELQQQQGGQQYAYGGKVNKYAYAGPLRPEQSLVIPSAFTISNPVYHRSSDVPQEVYDWYASLSPEEQMEILGNSSRFSYNRGFEPEANSWYNKWKNDTEGWLGILTDNPTYGNASGSSEDDAVYRTKMRKAVVDAYNTRRDKNGKYIRYNLPLSMIYWYMNLPKDQQLKIISNTKMKGKDPNTVLRYANAGAPKAVANAITEAYNAADGQLPVATTTSNTATSNATASNTAASRPSTTSPSTTTTTSGAASLVYSYPRKRMTGRDLMKALGFTEIGKDSPITLEDLHITRWDQLVDPDKVDTDAIYAKVTNPMVKDLITQGYNPLGTPVNTDRWFEADAGQRYSWTDASRFEDGYDKSDLESLKDFYPYMDFVLDNLKNYDWSKGKLSKEDLMKIIERNPSWVKTNNYLKADRANRLAYIARRHDLNLRDGIQDDNFDKIWTGNGRDGKLKKIGHFEYNEDGSSKYVLEKGMEDAFDKMFWGTRTDGKLGVMYDVMVPAEVSPQNYEVDENGNPTGKILLDTNGYSQVGNPYSFYTKDENNPYAPYINNQVTYWRKGNASTGSTNPESKILSTELVHKPNYLGYTLGALPGLTGLAMMLAQGKPDTSGIEAAANYYANNAVTMAPPHLTHGLIKPAIIDPRNTHNTLTAARLGTNRLLRNTGSAPSQAASILANDTNYQHQMGLNDLRDWLANREQEQKAATFNEGVARANAQFLNQTDQFNAQLLANAADRSAQLRYNAEKEKLDQNNAYRAGILGNIGSAMTGVYNAWRDEQNRWERNMLAASLAPQNDWFAKYYGISDYDPDTGLIVKGLNKGLYLDPNNPNNGKYYKNSVVPSLATQPIVATTTAAKGGKLKRKTKKRKGFTF